MIETPFSAFRHLVNSTVEVLKNSPDKYKDVIEELELFERQRLGPAWLREKNALHSPYVIALVGLTNVGKSTLMEELLKAPVAPRKMGPATSIPVEYIYDSIWKIKVRYRGAVKSPDEYDFPDSAQLGNKLRDIVVDVDSEKASRIIWVTVRGPMETLSQELRLVDTPGFGAAHTASEQSATDQMLEEFIKKQIDRVYFCVASGGALTVSKIETDFLEKIAPICGHVLVTKWQGSVKDEQEYRKRYEGLFHGAKMNFVNAKTGQLDTLRDIVETCSTPERRIKLCHDEVLSAWEDINDHLRTIYRFRNVPWIKDRYTNFLNACWHSGVSIRNELHS